MRTKFLTTLLVASTLLAGCSSSGDKSSNESNTPPIESETQKEASSKESSKSNSKTQVYGVGETIEVDGLKITVNSSQDTDEVDQFNDSSDLDEGNTYNILDITVENDTDKDVTISSLMSFEIKDENGRKGSYVMSIRDNGKMDGTVLPGDKLSGELVYQVPRNGELNLYFTTSGFGGKTVKIKVR